MASKFSEPGVAASRWGLRDIRWRMVVTYQSYGTLVLGILPCVALVIVAHFSWDKNPRQRPAFLYDTSISYTAGTGTISDATAPLYNWIAQLLTVFAIEFWALYKRQSITQALSKFITINFFCFAGWIYSLAGGEITKPLAGELRPNFLSVCNPQLTPGSAPFSLFEEVNCTETGSAVDGARLGFPSGHASNSMSVAWFTMLFILYAYFLRAPTIYRQSSIRGSLFPRLWAEAKMGFVSFWALFVVAISWFIGVTRFFDNLHHPADIVGGWLLGIIGATVAFVQSVGVVALYDQEIQLEEASAIVNHDNKNGLAMTSIEAQA